MTATSKPTAVACKLVLLSLLFLVWQPSVWAAKLTVTYLRPDAAGDDRNRYPLKVLALALDRAKVEYELQPSKANMTQSRALTQMAQGVDIDVVWTMTSKEREEVLLPIRIPLEKGLLGWRIFFIQTKNAGKFAAIKSLDDLKQYEAGQGHDWPDTDILRASGLKVKGSPSYDSIFKMLEAGRFDYFPRSVIEIWDEAKSHPGMGLEIENTVVLQYPTAQYFFVNKKNTQLAGLIESGLQLALKDGSFDKLFLEQYGEDLKRANLKGRTHFLIGNPLLPAQTPLQDKRLWLSF